MPSPNALLGTVMSFGQSQQALVHSVFTLCSLRVHCRSLASSTENETTSVFLVDSFQGQETSVPAQKENSNGVSLCRREILTRRSEIQHFADNKTDIHSALDRGFVRCGALLVLHLVRP